MPRRPIVVPAAAYLFRRRRVSVVPLAVDGAVAGEVQRRGWFIRVMGKGTGGSGDDVIGYLNVDE